MLFPLNLNATNHTLFTVFLVVGIVVGCLWIIGWLIGRPWTRP